MAKLSNNFGLTNSLGLSNNFGALRLLFALLVIVSHAPELIDGNRSREILTCLFGTLSFGEVAVDGFFLISGYLITKSFLQSRTAGAYLIKRVARIYPGYVAAYLLCILALGPFVGGQPSGLRPTGVVIEMALLHPPAMPGVFAGLPYPALNGSMWTIAYEFGCYVLVLILGAAGLLSNRPLLAALTVAALALSSLHLDAPAWFPSALGDPNTGLRFLGIFGCGGLFYLYRDRIHYDGRRAALAACGLILALFSPLLAEAAFAMLGGYGVFWFAFNVASRRLAAIGQKTDISYGLYLYAWPVQNLLIWLSPGISPWMVAIETTAIAGILAFGSWHAIEKPFMAMRSVLLEGIRTGAAATGTPPERA